MKVSRLKRGNANFPEKKETGDVTVLASGDIFCWDGLMWQLVGGRYLSEEIREDFLSYVSNGWPTADDAKFDLPVLFKLDIFLKEREDDSVPHFKKQSTWVDKFISRIIEVSNLCQKASQE